MSLAHCVLPIGTLFHPKAPGLDGVAVAAAITRSLDLSAGARLVGIALLDYVNRNTGIAWPSTALLAKELGVSRSTISRNIGELQEKGVIFVVRGRTRETNGKRKAGRWDRNAYAFRWGSRFHRALLPNGAVTEIDPSCVHAPTASVLSVSQNPHTTCTDSLDRSEKKKSEDPPPNPLPAARPQSTPPEERTSPPVRPTDPIPFEKSPETPPPPLAWQKPSAWTPMQDDAERFLEFCRERTGGGDLGYAAETLGLVVRGAQNVGDVIELLRSKLQGRRPQSNAYIRAVVADHFGETAAQKAARMAAERSAFHSERHEIEQARQSRLAAMKAADTAGDEAEILRLVKLGDAGWLRLQREGAAA